MKKRGRPPVVFELDFLLFRREEVGRLSAENHKFVPVEKLKEFLDDWDSSEWPFITGHGGGRSFPIQLKFTDENVAWVLSRGRGVYAVALNGVDI